MVHFLSFDCAWDNWLHCLRRDWEELYLSIPLVKSPELRKPRGKGGTTWNLPENNLTIPSRQGEESILRSTERRSGQQSIQFPWYQTTQITRWACSPVPCLKGSLSRSSPKIQHPRGSAIRGFSCKRTRPYTSPRVSWNFCRWIDFRYPFWLR